jgi:acetyltransferase
LIHDPQLELAPQREKELELIRKLGFNVDIQLEEGIVGLTLNLAQREES